MSRSMYITVILLPDLWCTLIKTLVWCILCFASFQAEMMKQAFSSQRQLLVTASSSQKPSDVRVPCYYCNVILFVNIKSFWLYWWITLCLTTSLFPLHLAYRPSWLLCWPLYPKSSRMCRRSERRTAPHLSSTTSLQSARVSPPSAGLPWWEGGVWHCLNLVH